jgi:hypothetical protein
MAGYVRTSAVFAAAFAVALTGCTSTKNNFRPATVSFSEPPLGVTHTVSIGDTLVKQGTYSSIPAIKLNEEFAAGIISGYRFFPGYYVKVGEDKNSEFFEPEISSEGGRVKSGSISDPYSGMQVLKDRNTICGVSTLGTKACKDNVNFERITRPRLTSDNFQQSLIYNGRVGNKLRIGYREFSNNAARPAFNNDVEYDLDVSKTIAYRGAKIEVISATNEQIVYRVISNFNAAVI